MKKEYEIEIEFIEGEHCKKVVKQVYDYLIDIYLEKEKQKTKEQMEKSNEYL